MNKIRKLLLLLLVLIGLNAAHSQNLVIGGTGNLGLSAHSGQTEPPIPVQTEPPIPEQSEPPTRMI